VPVSDKYKCIFIHIPKCAGTSIEKELDIYGDWQNPDFNMLFGTIHQYNYEFELQHLTTRQMLLYNYININKFMDYYKFSFVRNPWDKAISAYLYMGGTEGVYTHSNFKMFLIETRKQIANFKKDAVWCHMAPQNWFLFDDTGNKLVDYVGRFENLREGAHHVFLKLGVPSHQLLHEKKAVRKPYQYYYRKSTRELIAEIYKDDIDLFGYKY
jgi:chondroitin 4-sulfotransferase 11